MRWMIVTVLTLMVVGAIVWDARRGEQETLRAWALVAAVLAGTAILALAVMSRWVFGADVY